MKKIAIVGAGGFGREVLWLINEINKTNSEWLFQGFFDDEFADDNLVQKDFRLGSISDINNYPEELFVVLAIGNPLVKKKLEAQIQNPKIKFATLIHPNVLIGNEVHIGEGSIICGGCIVTVNIEIGKHVILNLGCTVGHDTVIGAYSSFMPSVNISGEVHIGAAVYGGTGAKIINRLEIGDNTVIGAGAVVSKSLPANCTAVGIPAKPIKFHS